MNIELIIQSVMGLVGLLAVLLMFLFFTSSSKTKKKSKNLKKKEAIKKKTSSSALSTDLKTLRAIIKNKETKAKELREALELVIKHHGTIHAKLGRLPHPEFEPYKDILFTICRHPNIDKDMIINFDKNLGQLNPEYKPEINDAITKGLTSRRV